MPTQQQIAEHLDLSQQAVAEMVERLSIDWRATPMDVIRIAYIRHLRGQASGHKSEDGLDLVRERVLTERVDRELKELQVAEKKGVLVNVAQLEPMLSQMIGAFRTELLARDDKLADELRALHGIEIDVDLLHEHTRSALAQLSRYDAGREGTDTPAGGDTDASRDPDDNGMGAPPQAPVRESDREARPV